MVFFSHWVGGNFLGNSWKLTRVGTTVISFYSWGSESLQGDTAGKWQGRNLNQGNLDAESANHCARISQSLFPPSVWKIVSSCHNPKKWISNGQVYSTMTQDGRGRCDHLWSPLRWHQESSQHPSVNNESSSCSTCLHLTPPCQRSNSHLIL